jgi:hypothetical protein
LITDEEILHNILHIILTATPKTITCKINTVLPKAKNSEVVYDSKMQNTKFSYKMKGTHTEQVIRVARVLSATCWCKRQCTGVLTFKPTTSKEQ